MSTTPQDGYTQRVKPTLEELQAILDSPDPIPYATLGGKAKLTEEELEAALACPLPHPAGGCVEIVRLTELRARPGYWLDVAASGRTLVLTRKGQAMAMLGPVPAGTKVRT